MSNGIMHRIIECSGGVAANATHLSLQMYQGVQQKMRLFTDLTGQTANEIRKQGYFGCGAAVLGFLGTIIGTLEGFSHPKLIGTLCNQAGSVLSSGSKATETELNGRTSILNTVMPDGKKIADEIRQHAQGYFSTLSRLQEQSGRSHVGG